MSQRKKNPVPEWQYHDNAYGSFAIIRADIAKSPQFQALSAPARLFYFICNMQAREPKAQATLIKHFEEVNVFKGNPKEADTSFYKDWNKGYFVFPKDHLKKYGYKQPYAVKLMKELIEAGFIEKVEDNSKIWKVNVYRFSGKFKQNTVHS